MSQCEHLSQKIESSPAATSEGCQECEALGQAWVQLRKCETCGHIGCCDSSIGKHATKHFHETGHPVISSAEPGEDWRWCFVDQEMG